METTKRHHRVTNWQRLVLRIVFDAVESTGDQYGYVKYSELAAAVRDFTLDEEVNNREVNSCKAMLSRAITALCDKGYLVGWYRTWFAYSGYNNPGGAAGLPTDTETARRLGRTWRRTTRPGARGSSICN